MDTAADGRHPHHAEERPQRNDVACRGAPEPTGKLPVDAALLAVGERHAPRPGLHGVDVHDERLPLARAAYLDRPRERVPVVLRREPRLEVRLRVERPTRVRHREPNGVTRIDGHDGRQVAREVPVERPPLERELVDHASSVRTAAATRPADGTYKSSSVQYGYGTS